MITSQNAAPIPKYSENRENSREVNDVNDCVFEQPTPSWVVRACKRACVYVCVRHEISQKCCDRYIGNTAVIRDSFERAIPHL